MSATGATLTVTAPTCASSGTNGSVFNVGCQLSIVANNMTDWTASADTYEYFVVTPSITNTATAIPTTGCNPNPWTGNTGTTCSSASTTLSIQGS
jgi:hypothetical protein